MHALAQDDGASRLDNSSLLSCDLGKRVTQDTHVIETNAGDGNNMWVGSARGIPAATHAHLEHGNVDTFESVNSQSCHREQVKGCNGKNILPRRGASLVNASASLICGRNTLREQII